MDRSGGDEGYRLPQFWFIIATVSEFKLPLQLLRSTEDVSSSS